MTFQVPRHVLGLLPALLVVVFAGVIALIGLALRQSGRQYALSQAKVFVDMAGILVGNPRKPPDPDQPNRSDPSG
jgi:hypothetical protein